MELLHGMVDPANEDDARVRARALAALAARDPDNATTVLIQRLAAEDPYEALAAGRGLARIGASEAAAPIQQAYLVVGEDAPRAKAGLLGALATLDPESPVSRVRARPSMAPISWCG